MSKESSPGNLNPYLPDILRYEHLVPPQIHSQEAQKATGFRDEMIDFLRRDTMKKLAPLELGPDQLTLFPKVFMCATRKILRLAETYTTMNGNIPKFVLNWQYQPEPEESTPSIARLSSDVSYEEDEDEVAQLKQRITRQLDLLQNQIFYVMVHWSITPGFVPWFRICGKGLYLWASDIDFLGFPKIPESPEEAERIYKKTLALYNNPDPLFWTYDDWHTINIDWRDEKPENQAIRHQAFFHIGRFHSEVFGNPVYVYATSDTIGLRRRFMEDTP
jgi:hypothetical protein